MREKLRMAKADLRGAAVSAEARALLDAIRQRYQQLEALPQREKPDSNRRGPGSVAYLALEAEIRSLAQQYAAVTVP